MTGKPRTNGPFKFGYTTVQRRRDGQSVPTRVRCIIDCHGTPVDFGSRKKLASNLERLNLRYARHLMTVGTKAEGL